MSSIYQVNHNDFDAGLTNALQRRWKDDQYWQVLTKLGMAGITSVAGLQAAMRSRCINRLLKAIDQKTFTTESQSHIAWLPAADARPNPELVAFIRSRWSGLAADRVTDKLLALGITSAYGLQMAVKYGNLNKELFLCRMKPFSSQTLEAIRHLNPTPPN